MLGNVLARVVIDKADEVPETRGGGEEPDAQQLGTVGNPQSELLSGDLAAL